MKGHVRERGKGNWYAVLDVRDPATGKRRRKWHSLQAKGKREAQIECARLIHEMSTGAYIVPSRATLAAYLEVWLADIKSRITPKTHLRYSELARKNIVTCSRRPSRRLTLACLRAAIVKAADCLPEPCAMFTVCLSRRSRRQSAGAAIGQSVEIRVMQ
jgi:dTDP-4-amino-4,6-dideoxygalactose transaminase